MSSPRPQSAWLRSCVTAPVRFYRRYLTRFTPATCRFHPTCSAYCVQAIQERGILRGAGLTLWRILRCQPFSKGGYDPVPSSNAEPPRLFPADLSPADLSPADPIEAHAPD